MNKDLETDIFGATKYLEDLARRLRRSGARVDIGDAEQENADEPESAMGETMIADTQSSPEQSSPVRQMSTQQDVPPFILANGMSITGVNELLGMLPHMPDDVFHHHVTPHKNDFATWIYHAHNDERLAQALAHVKDKHTFAQTLQEHTGIQTLQSSEAQGFGETDPWMKKQQPAKDFQALNPWMKHVEHHDPPAQETVQQETVKQETAGQQAQPEKQAPPVQDTAFEKLNPWLKKKEKKEEKRPETKSAPITPAERPVDAEKPAPRPGLDFKALNPWMKKAEPKPTQPTAVQPVMQPAERVNPAQQPTIPTPPVPEAILPTPPMRQEIPPATTATIAPVMRQPLPAAPPPILRETPSTEKERPVTPAPQEAILKADTAVPTIIGASTAAAMPAQPMQTTAPATPSPAIEIAQTSPAPTSNTVGTKSSLIDIASMSTRDILEKAGIINHDDEFIAEEEKPKELAMRRPALTTGVPGFDDMIPRGIPSGHAILVSGGPGSGKTTFAIQTLGNAAKRGEKCLFLTLEETEEELIAHLESYGFDPQRYIREGNLLISAQDPFKISRMIEALLAHARGELLIDIEEVLNIMPPHFEPSVVVLDSLSAIASAFNESDTAYRIYVNQLINILKRTGATSFLINEVQGAETSGHGLAEEFLADGVIIFYNLQKRDLKQPALEILKMRSSAHEKRIVPFMFQEGTGIVVYPLEKTFM